MGVWSFVKGAGKKIFGKAEAATPDLPPDEALKKEMKDLGLDAEELEFKVEGEKVVIKGTAASPEVQQKVILAAGNVEGIAEVEAEAAGPEPRFHTVAKGDTLSAIAKKTLGNANRYNEIFEANRPMLTHPDKIYPGQVLRIPES
ncbi:MAG: peptidoglycan-binding protein LysM [Gemmobacter sp.]